MNDLDFLYHWENLQALDPDQLVSDLGLTTDDILSAFHERAEKFVKENFG